MRRCLVAVCVLLAGAAPGLAQGLLVPKETSVPPLALLRHDVRVEIDDQVARTRVEQVFRNHTDRQLEATYVFPVPKGASVRKFSMWVGGKEVPGELVEAAKARSVYESIVRRTQDPGLLEYMGQDLLRLRVFPVLPRSEQKVAVSFSAVAPAESGLVQYRYPLKTDGKAVATLEKFSLTVKIKSQHALTNIYSPTHAITVTRPGDHEANVVFEKNQGLLDRDFLLYYSDGGKDVGLTALTHRPVGGDGYFLMLISPRPELSKARQVPRDMVFVLDTSGSMRGKRMEQARAALQYCLGQLRPQDRFGLMNFATTVNKYNEQLLPANTTELARARKWVGGLEATGGTAINDALAAALEMRGSDAGRIFTVVFFTDGRPTIGETDPEKILKAVQAKNTAATRIFTFGVGDDVNATFLDALADQTRAVSNYVRESEHIEAKVSDLYAKISNPVLTNLKLQVTGGIKLSEVYPPQLPDLFHGTQLVVLGRYSGQGHAAVRLSGSVGKEAQEFVYETVFPKKTADGRAFVEDLWARRKVGYMLDEIRRNGQKKELVDEVVRLAKRYGITTPYTSYLVVPDAPVPVARAAQGRPDVAFRLGGGPGGTPAGGSATPGRGAGGGTGNGSGFPGAGIGGFGGGFGGVPPALDAPLPAPGRPTTFGQIPRGPAGKAKAPTSVKDFATRVQNKPGEASKFRGEYAQYYFDEAAKREGGDKGRAKLADGLALDQARRQWMLNRDAKKALSSGDKEGVQAGRLGVDLSLQSNALRNQCQLSNSAVRCVQNRNCLNVAGVWIDEGFDPKMKTVEIKAMSKAYFRLLRRHPEVREVFRLGNHLVWVTPNGTALVVDSRAGREEMSDRDIDALFATAKK
jgi:Ca-activated chloride channel family protein